MQYYAFPIFIDKENWWTPYLIMTESKHIYLSNLFFNC